MPTASPALESGIQTLGEAIQLTPASPGLAIISTARNILQIINADKAANQDEQRLAQMVLDIAVAYSDGMKKLDEIRSKDAEIERISNNLHRCLESISKTILNKPKAGFLARLLMQSPNRRRIKSWEADLEQVSLHLTTQIQLRTVKMSQVLSDESDKGAMQEVTTMQQRIQEANQEALDLIKSQVLKQTSKELQKSSFGHFPPAASPIFCGRSKQVDWLVDSLVGAPAYHALLGPGGIGKTSVALNMLHDPRIVEVYGEHRYFLTCETTSDAGGIAAGLANIFSLNERVFLKQFKGLCEVIGSNILFLLDNFETAWERKEARQKVEDFLTDLSSIPNLSIVITLRGAERPGGIRWSRPFMPVLGPLDLSAACQTFVAIADVGYGDPDLARLMEAVEFIPLAITLLAAQASYTSCTFLLEQWQTCKTSMITRGWDSRLSSLDVSISLSLASSRFISNPQALSLPQVLSLLPDGATVQELQQMTADDIEIHQSVSTLLQVALANSARHDRISVLAPIRVYIQSKHPMSLTLLRPVFSYHAGLSRYAEESKWTAESVKVDDRLNPCIGNIHSVIRIGLTVEELTDEALDASINIAAFRQLSRFGSIGQLLEEAATTAREGSKLAFLAACLNKIAIRMWDIRDIPFDRHLALGYLEESVKISRSLPPTPENTDLLVSTLNDLSWYLKGRWRRREALETSQQAVDSISPSTSPFIAAKAYLNSASCLIVAQNFSESRNRLELAGSYVDPSSSPVLNYQRLQCYYLMYLHRDMYSQSLKAVDMGLSLPAMTSSVTRRCRSLIMRGDVCVCMGRFESARKDYLEAVQGLAFSGSPTEISQVYCMLGLTYIAHGRFEDAELSIRTSDKFNQTSFVDSKLTLAILELFQNHFNQALQYLDLSLKELDLMGFQTYSPGHFLRLAIQCQVQVQQRATSALSCAVLAVVTAHKIQGRSFIAASILALGDAYLFNQNDVSASKSCYEAHLDMVRYLGNWRWIASGLLRLGVTDYFQGNSPLATRRLRQAVGFYKETGGEPWVEMCNKVLRAIEDGANMASLLSRLRTP